MGANLEALFELQEVETQLVDCHRGLESRRRQIRAVSRRVAQVLEEREQTLQRARDRQLAADALELEVKSREADITRLRETLNRAKSNKEYAAVLTELNTYKADNSKHEEQVLQMMTEVDAVKEQAQAQLAECEKEKRRLAELEGVFAEYEATVNQRIADLMERRAAVTAGLNGEILTTFERVAAKHDGEGLAEVQQENPRRQEFSCGGCSMAVTLEQVNLLSKSERVVTCNSCGRILHLSSGEPITR